MRVHLRGDWITLFFLDLFFFFCLSTCHVLIQAELGAWLQIFTASGRFHGTPFCFCPFTQVQTALCTAVSIVPLPPEMAATCLLTHLAWRSFGSRSRRAREESAPSPRARSSCMRHSDFEVSVL